MKRGVMAAMLVAVFGALAAASLAAPSSKPAKAICGLRLVVVAPPGLKAPSPTATSGSDFGLVNCPVPFGKGVQADSFKVSPTSATAGTVSGPFKQYFDAGTIHGAFKLSFTAGATGTTYTGTATVVGGTGAFKAAKGTGTLKCTSPDGIHTSCTAHLSLTAI